MTNKAPGGLIAAEDVARWGARASDEVRRRENERAGHTLCEHCRGTGNELYSMYRTCQHCSSGIRSEEHTSELQSQR